MWQIIHLPTAQVVYTTDKTELDAWLFINDNVFAMVENHPMYSIIKCDKSMSKNWINYLKYNGYNPIELNGCEFEIVECGK